MSQVRLTKVEQSFQKESGITSWSTKVPYIIVENFPKLGCSPPCVFWNGC
jgi:glucosamine-6-phosphate deaminase